jgi:hypothetical protein
VVVLVRVVAGVVVGVVVGSAVLVLDVAVEVEVVEVFEASAPEPESLPPE